MSHIHETAIIHPNAKIADNVTIGAYCVIGEHVEISQNVVIHSHVAIDGRTSIGEGCQIFPFASLGHAPQDLKFGGEASKLVIGKNNVIREHVTMNPGTKGGGMLTQVGDNCLFMMATHVAHDCMVGNHVILANNATLAGHVTVGDFAIIGGLSAVHQFVRIGHNAMVGGMSAVAADIVPYGSVTGERAHLAGLNLVGMKRRSVEKKNIHAVRALYKSIFSSDAMNSGKTLSERANAAMDEAADIPEVKEMLAFLLEDSSRSFCLPA